MSTSPFYSDKLDTKNQWFPSPGLVPVYGKGSFILENSLLTYIKSFGHSLKNVTKSYFVYVASKFNKEKKKEKQNIFSEYCFLKKRAGEETEENFKIKELHLRNKILYSKYGFIITNRIFCLICYKDAVNNVAQMVIYIYYFKIMILVAFNFLSVVP